MQHFIGTIVAETEKAYLFQDWFWHEPDWMPKSQAEVVRVRDEMEVQLFATPWICRAKGVREFTEWNNTSDQG